MPIAVGGTNINDIRIGSTVINSVWVNGSQVWSRLSLSTNPASGSNTNTAFNNATAFATVTVSANVSATWSFSRVNGSTAFTTGGSSGTSTFVRLSNSNQPTSYLFSTVDVTATVGGSSVTTRVVVRAYKEWDVNEGGGG
jgi:hypothetical protein